MAEHTYIKIPRIKTIFENKTDAVERTKTYIEQHLSDFHDGESLLIRFKGDEGEVVSARVFVNISNDNVVSLSFGLDSKETTRVVETSGEPEDKEVLWLTDQIDKEDITVAMLQKKIKFLETTIINLSELIEKHEYALTHTLCGGDFMTNSMKYELANENEREKPIDITGDEPYTTGDTKIVRFELYLANTNLTYYTTNGGLYKQQFYYLEPRYYNAEDELVDDSGVTLDMQSSREDIAVAQYYERGGRWYLYGNTSGVTKITATATVPRDNESGYTELVNSYSLNFKYNQQTDYEQYFEPNVKHILVKTADTYDILSGNTDYLLLNEFVWCIGNNSLYFKALGSNGTINLFKINGGGDTPIPVTSGISFEIDSAGVLDIEDKNTPQEIYVDQDGILNLIGFIDSDGILNLDNSSAETHIIDEEGNLVLNNMLIDDDGYLVFANASFDENNNLIMN